MAPEKAVSIRVRKLNGHLNSNAVKPKNILVIFALQNN